MLTDSQCADIARLLIWLHDFRAERAGSPMSAHILTNLYVAHVEGRPVDQTALSNAVKLPRTTLRRFLLDLDQRGLVIQSRGEGGRIYVRLTTEALAPAGPRFETIFRRLGDTLGKVIAAGTDQ